MLPRRPFWATRDDEPSPARVPVDAGGVVSTHRPTGVGPAGQSSWPAVTTTLPTIPIPSWNMQMYG